MHSPQLQSIPLGLPLLAAPKTDWPSYTIQSLSSFRIYFTFSNHFTCDQLQSNHTQTRHTHVHTHRHLAGVHHINARKVRTHSARTSNNMRDIRHRRPCSSALRIIRLPSADTRGSSIFAMRSTALAHHILQRICSEIVFCRMIKLAAKESHDGNKRFMNVLFSDGKCCG